MPNPYTHRVAPLRAEPSRAEFFATCVNNAVRRVMADCPDALTGIDIGVDDVPTPSAMWEGLTLHGVVPMAAAIDPQQGRPAAVVIYRRPLEHRALNRWDLNELVHHTLVEQLSVLTGRSLDELDPHFEEGW
jgi:predicted Zn-dependent protease with MMP-like domain